MAVTLQGREAGAKDEQMADEGKIPPRQLLRLFYNKEGTACRRRV